MVDKKLDIDGPFEGILGLGIPHSKELMSGASPKPGAVAKNKPIAPDPRTFLERSGVNRFSICFNEGSDGVLRFRTPPPATPLASVGKLHWGLDFRGISVGDSNAAVQFCSKDSMTKGMETACGAIPDSGTTLIMAPKEHLSKLFASICDRWPRCAMRSTEMAAVEKVVLFQKLLHNCGEWMDDEKGIMEMPSLHFRAATQDGSEQTLELHPEDYVLRTEATQMHYVTKHLKNLIPGLPLDIVFESPGPRMKVCTTAFGVHTYNTQQNGQIWIFGTPFFFRFRVAYDMSSKPSIAFSEEPCQACGDIDDMAALQQHSTVKPAALQKSSMSSTSHVFSRLRTGWPRQHWGPVHMNRQLNVSLPL